MTDNKEWHEKTALRILNKYTEKTKFSALWEFPIGLIGDIEKELDEAYSAGVKEGTRAERERITQKIIDMQFAFPGFANKTVDRIVESIR